MTINQLKYILIISKSSSMREAAGRLYVSQPALSASLRELEEELGILLFDRTNKGISLTKEGYEFLTYAKQVVSQYEVLEDKYLGQDREREHFSVSTQHYTFSIHAFIAVIKGCDSSRYSFSIHETRTEEVLENVRSMQSEVGIISFSAQNEKLMRKLFKEYQLTFTPLMKREAYAYFWENNKLAKRKSISLQELKEYPCISFEQKTDSDFYLQEESFSNYDFDKIIKSDDRATSMEMIANLGGYSIGTGMLAEDNVTLKGLVAVKLKEEDPLTIGYIVRNGAVLSELGESYIAQLQNYKEHL